MINKRISIFSFFSSKKIMKNAAFHTAHILSRQDGCHKYILYRPNANLNCSILRQLMLRMVMLLLAYFQGNYFRLGPGYDFRFLRKLKMYLIQLVLMELLVYFLTFAYLQIHFQGLKEKKMQKCNF